jgi:hypothetical protein
MFSFIIWEHTRETFWVYLLSFLVFTIFAIPYVIISEKKRLAKIKAKEDEEFSKFQRVEFERKEKEKKSKKELELIYASFLTSNCPLIDQAEIAEILNSFWDIHTLTNEESPERVALYLHRITKTLPVSMQPLLMAVIASKWIQLKEDSEGGDKKYSIEDLYSSVVNQ